MSANEPAPSSPSIEQTSSADPAPAVPRQAQPRVDRSTMALSGAGSIVLGTTLPWIQVTYGSASLRVNGWALTYGHAPHFTLALIPSAAGVVAFAIALLSFRRPMVLRHALGPALLSLGFFIWMVLAFGEISDAVRAYSTLLSSALSYGVWVVAGGAAVLGAAALVADPSPRRALVRRLELWGIVGAVEVALLAGSPNGLLPPFFALAALAACAAPVIAAISREGAEPRADTADALPQEMHPATKEVPPWAVSPTGEPWRKWSGEMPPTAGPDPPTESRPA